MEEVKKLLVPAVSTYCPQAYTYTFCTQPLAGRMDGCMDGCNGSSLWFNERFNVLHLSFPEDEGLILTLNLWSYEKLLVKNNKITDLHMAYYLYPAVGILFTSIYS